MITCPVATAADAFTLGFHHGVGQEPFNVDVVPKGAEFPYKHGFREGTLMRACCLAAHVEPGPDYLDVSYYVEKKMLTRERDALFTAMEALQDEVSR